MSYIHGEISMRQKHAQERQANRRMWWPRVGRLAEAIVIRRPWWGSAKAFALAMASKLPQFEFNSRKDWWQADLTMEHYRVVVEFLGEATVWSEGICEWAEAQEQEAPLLIERKAQDGVK